MDWGQRRFESSQRAGPSGGINWRGAGPGNISNIVSVGGAGRNEGGQVPFGPPEIFPTVDVLPPRPTASVSVIPSAWDDTVVFEEEDPQDYGQVAFPRQAPVPVTFPRRAPTRVPVVISTQEPILPPADTEVEDVPLDWGGFLGGVAQNYISTRFTPPAQNFGFAAPITPAPTFDYSQPTVTTPVPQAVPMANGCSTCPTGSPRYSKICNATGEVTPLRRRRRRRLLTAGDLHDIASLKAIVGGGAALNAAVVKAMK